MKQMNSMQLLDSLQADVRRFVLELSQLQQLPASLLEQAPAAGKWSVAQVLDHLNGYGHYYLPVLQQSLQKAGPAKTDYKPGWLGDYFTRLMEPDANGTIARQMKAPKGHRPVMQQNGPQNVVISLQQQYELLELLERAKAKDIAGVRTPVSVSRLLTLKAGDTFRFLVAHQNRHLLQISRVLHVLQHG